MKTTLAALALILAASGAAHAQEITHLSYGLGYSSFDGGGTTIDTTTVDGTIEYSINQIYLMGDLDGSFLSSGGSSNEITGLKLRAGYEFAPGSLAYLGIGQINIFGTDATTYEAGAQYDFGAGQVGLHYVNIDDAGVEDATIALDYEVSTGTRIGIAHTSSSAGAIDATILFGSYENGPLTVDASYDTYSGGNLDLARIAATYEFGGQFRAMGALGYIDLSGSDVTRVSIGGGYQVADNMWIDANYANLSGSGIDVDTFGISFIFETGERTLVVDRAFAARAVPFNEIGSMFTIAGELSEFGTVGF